MAVNGGATVAKAPPRLAKRSRTVAAGREDPSKRRRTVAKPRPGLSGRSRTASNAPQNPVKTPQNVANVCRIAAETSWSDFLAFSWPAFNFLQGPVRLLRACI